MDMTLIAGSALASGPEIIVIIGACAALMISLLPNARQENLLASLSIIIIALAAGMSFALPESSQREYSGMFVVDSFSKYFKMVLYLATALTVLMSGKYLVKEGVVKGEYYVLLLFALVGTMIMVSGTDLLIIYVGIELQAISIYVLVGFLKADARSNEAALKYIILGAFSSGILLYGMSLFYGLSGTTNLDAIAEALFSPDFDNPMLLMATLFMLVGLLFKVGAVPFHMWVPDIYEGAPSPITAFMSVAAKAAAFAVILRIFLDELFVLSPIWLLGVSGIAILSMALGSLAALVQTNIKRMLAYSSIAHAGFLLLGLIAGGANGVASIMQYVVVFTFMNLGMFAIIILLNKGVKFGEPIESFAGLSKTHPMLALMTMIFLFSLAGIPPTGGFFVKFYVLLALIETGYIWLAVIAVLLSAVAAWFYLRIIMLMYVHEPSVKPDIHITLPMQIVLAVTVLGTVLTGIFPTWLLEAARSAALLGMG
ncbi:MAG: NADH-quinone oxidoreductase subunit N [Rhodobacteraceae bacterium]|nr:NADH-quinone oxidoreductase subunit N [Paracoccaceae bacterium]